MQRPEPTSTELKLDALVARLTDPHYDLETTWDVAQQAAAALVQLRDSEALARGKIAEQMIEIERLKMNQRCSAIEQGEVGYPCVFRAEAESRITALEAENARLSPPLLDRNELLRPPFTHTRSCVALTPGNDESCTCGLHWRIQLATRITLQDAWTKRATEAETEVARLMLLLRNAMNWIYEAGTASGYGFYRTKNPHDFSPDPESCTADEFANHKAACDLWDRGEYDSSKEKGSEWLRSEDGKLVAHILRAPWGIGSYSETVPQVQALIDAIKAAREKP